MNESSSEQEDEGDTEEEDKEPSSPARTSGPAAGARGVRGAAQRPLRWRLRTPAQVVGEPGGLPDAEVVPRVR